MATLKRLGWTSLLIAVQPAKLIVSIASVAMWVLYDVGREFLSDLRSIWTAA
jgi:hypothetical protein